MDLRNMTDRDKLKFHIATLLAIERKMKKGKWEGTPELKKEILQKLKILQKAKEEIEEQRRDLEEKEKQKL